jgi:hypothetical protein
MQSFRDIATSADDADSLQTSLRELQRRRQAKQRRLQRDREASFVEEADTFSPMQELAYSREVLHTWTRQYPRLRDAVTALASRRGSEPDFGGTVAFVEHDDAAGSSSAGVGGIPNSLVISPATAAGSVGFSVADTMKRAYPPVWVIPAGTVPASYYTDSRAMDDSLQLSSVSSTPQRQFLASNTAFHRTSSDGNVLYAASSHVYQLHPDRLGAAVSNNPSSGVTDCNQRRCFIQIRREALQLPASATATAATPSAAHTPTTTALASWSPSTSVSSVSLSTAQHTLQQQQQTSQKHQQRVLARWPQGKAPSTKVSAVLRSIDIDARKREQWNEHVRRQQQQQQQRDDKGSDHKDHPISTETRESLSREFTSQTPPTSYSAVRMGLPSDGDPRRGSLPTLSEDVCGRELYWPAYITNTRAVFTGAACLHDDYRGLGLLQLYERFDTVLALALASPLQLVVDVVYAIDETSEGCGLSIDPVVRMSAATTDDDSDADNAEAVGGGWVGTSAFRSLFADAPPHSPHASEAPTNTTTDDGGNDTCYPLLLPSSLPAVISDLNYAFQPAPPPPSNANSAAASTTAAEARRRRSSASTITATATAASPDSCNDGAATATLHRSTLSTAPLSAYSILAGPVSQSRLMVLLRPTAEVVCAARARALQELELRWQRLRQALLNRLVAYEEEPPRPVSPTSEEGSDDNGAAAKQGEQSGMPLVALPDAASYVSPFVDRSAVQDDGLPEEPVGAVMLTEEEMRRQTRLPELQGAHRRQSVRKKRWDDADHGEGGSFPFAPSRSTSPQPAAVGASPAAAAARVAGPADFAMRGTRASQSSQRASSRGREHSLLSFNSVVDDAVATATIATTRSISPNSSRMHRLPVRRRPSQDSPSSDAAVADVSDGHAAAAALVANPASSRGPHPPPYTPRLVEFAQQAPTTRGGGALLPGAEYTATSSSFARRRDDVSAPTGQPRSLADPLPAQVDLSSSANGLNTMELSVEESRVLSAAVRAAAARQKALEDAIRSQQKPLAVPRSALPSRTVEAPSPVSPDTSAAPSVSRKEGRQQQQKHQPPLTASADITNNASAIDASPIVASTPPSPALPENARDLSRFSWDVAETSATGHGTLAQAHAHHRSRSSSSSPNRVGGMGVNESSSLQFTPPAAYRTPRQRFNERGELIIPSLSTTAATSPPTNQPSPVASATVVVPPTPASVKTGAMESAVVSFSTPPPPAPPSHSGSPAPRDVVVQNKGRPPPPSQQQPPRVSFITEVANLVDAAATQSSGDTAQQRRATARQLLPSSYPHLEIGSAIKNAAPTTAAPPVETAASHGRRSTAQSPTEKFSRTSTPHLLATLGGDFGGDASAKPVTSLVQHCSCHPSLSLSIDSAAPFGAGSDAPQPRSTAAYRNTAAASSSDSAHTQESTRQATPSLRGGRREGDGAPSPSGTVHVSPRNALQPAVTRNTHRDPETAGVVGRKASHQGVMSPVPLVRPSFSPAPSSSASSRSSSLLQDQHLLEPRHQQLPSQLAEASATTLRKTGVLQSPRSLAASAAAAALAKSMAERATAAAAASPATVVAVEVEPTMRQGHRPTESAAKDGGVFYNRGYVVLDTLGDFEKKATVHSAQQDSPLPRRPSLSKDAPVPALAKASAARVRASLESHSLSLHAETNNSPNGPLSAHHHRHPHHQQQQQRHHHRSEHASTSDSGAVLSSSVNREVELPISPLRKAEAPQHQQQPALAIPHRQPSPSVAVAAEPSSLHSIRALDDAELVRLYELLYRQPGNGPSIEAAQHQKRRRKKGIADEPHRPRQERPLDDDWTGSATANERSQKPEGPAACVSSTTPEEALSTVRAEAAAAPQSEIQAQEYRIRCTSACESGDGDAPTSLPKPHPAPQSLWAHPSGRHHHHRHPSRSAVSSVTQSPQRSRGARQQEERRGRDAADRADTPRSFSSRSHHHHHRRHHSRRHHRSRTNGRTTRSSCSSSNSDSDSAPLAVSPTAPTRVPPLRLKQLSPPPSRPSPSSTVSDTYHITHTGKGGESEAPAGVTAPAAVQRRAVAELVFPSTATAALHCRATSAVSSPSSWRVVATSPAPAAVEEAVVSTSSELMSPSVHHRHHNSPLPQEQQRQQRISARCSPQRTVLVRRVVRRRRSDVFVEEGGSLVFRTPTALHGPSRSRSSTPVSSSHARSAGKR